MRTHYLLVITLSILIEACSQTVSEDFSGLFGGELEATPTATDSAISGSGDTSSGGFVENSKYSTTTGGSITFASQKTITIGANETVKGFQVSPSGVVYMLIERTNGAIVHWLVERIDYSGGTVSTVCSLLDDGNFARGFDVDSENFYVSTAPSAGGCLNYKANFRKFKINDCSEQAVVVTNVCSGLDYDTSAKIRNQFKFSGSYLYYIYSDYTSQRSLIREKLQDSTYTYLTDASIGSESSHWAAVKSFSVSSTGIWGVFFSAGAGCPLLWKFSLSGAGLGWVDVSNFVESCGENSVFQVSALDDSSFFLTTVSNYTKEIKIFKFDVTNF